MVVFLFDLILLLIITVCQIITLVENSKIKINDNHVKTVIPSKFKVLSIKQRQEVENAIIHNTKHFKYCNTKKIENFPAEFKTTHM